MPATRVPAAGGMRQVNRCHLTDLVCLESASTAVEKPARRHFSMSESILVKNA
jgi:hypothetical protein